MTSDIQVAWTDGAYVLLEAGRAITGQIRSREEAEARRDTIRKRRALSSGSSFGETKTRKCLKCKRPFTSTGPGHRMCNTCREERPALGREYWGL